MEKFDLADSAACEEKCNENADCVAYDFEAGNGSSSCRLTAVDEPRTGTGRIYCVKLSKNIFLFLF